MMNGFCDGVVCPLVAACKKWFEILKMKSGQNDQVYEMRENGEAKRSKQQKTGQFNQHFAWHRTELSFTW